MCQDVAGLKSLSEYFNIYDQTYITDGIQFFI